MSKQLHRDNQNTELAVTMARENGESILGYHVRHTLPLNDWLSGVGGQVVTYWNS